MLADVLYRVANHRQSLTRADARAVMTEVLTGKCSDAQIAALLVALHMKGETVEEIVGFAEAIRAAATLLDLHGDSVLDASGTGRDALVDTCGTGGDASGTFNISTATAFVAAGAGVRVAKHGNRSVTSKCGSADVMEALGVNIDLPTARIASCLDQVGIAFLFAPALHSAMKYVQPVRRERPDVEDDLSVPHVLGRDARVGIDDHLQVRRIAIVDAPVVERPQQVWLLRCGLSHGDLPMRGRVTSARYRRMTFSDGVNASMNAGRLNKRSAYFIRGAACLPSWTP